MLKHLAIALLACSAHSANFAGRYVLEGAREVGSELLLKEDGTFEYVFIYGAADYQAKGTWKVDGGFMVLNTAAGGAPPFRLARSAAGDPQQARVWVKTPAGKGVSHIDVRLTTPDGEVAARTARDGDAVFPETRLARSVQFRIGVYDFEAGPFPLDPAHNEFFFEINGEAITRVPFKDERLKMDGGVLEMRFWNRERPLLYRRS